MDGFISLASSSSRVSFQYVEVAPFERIHSVCDSRVINISVSVKSPANYIHLRTFLKLLTDTLWSVTSYIGLLILGFLKVPLEGWCVIVSMPALAPSELDIF